MELSFRAEEPWLAPLAGWSDLPFRLLCREWGAAVCCTEMISAKGLVYGGRNTEDLLATVEGSPPFPGALPADAPLVAQIFGADPEFMARAVHLLRERGFCWFDVNMGCSVPKVTKTGSGAALLRDERQALAVARAVLQASEEECGPGHVGFKLRLGWSPGQEVWLSLAQALSDHGAGWLSLHPRWATQGFSGTPRMDAVAALTRAVPVPVVASGDLFTAEDGVRTLAETGASAVMYARGALRDPAVFARHRALLAQEPKKDAPGTGPAALGRIIRRHAALARHFTPRAALLKMRTCVPRYVRNLDGARALRQELIACTDWDSLDRLLDRFFSPFSADGTRHA